MVRDDLSVGVVLVESLVYRTDVSEDRVGLMELVKGGKKAIKDGLRNFSLIGNARMWLMAYGLL